ncbi:UNVERIFIED_CONTAM: hypothetical protein FKN15_064905 [Acipenser sinensis]
MMSSAAGLKPPGIAQGPPRSVQGQVTSALPVCSFPLNTSVSHEDQYTPCYRQQVKVSARIPPASPCHSQWNHIISFQLCGRVSRDTAACDIP